MQSDSAVRVLSLIHISDLHVGEIDPLTGNATICSVAARAARRFPIFDGLLGHQARSLQDLSRFVHAYRKDAEHPVEVLVTGDYTRCGGTKEFDNVRSYLQSQVTLVPSANVQAGLSLGTVPMGISGNHDQWGGVNFPLSRAASQAGTSALHPTFPYVWDPLPLHGDRSLVIAGVDSDADVASGDAMKRLLAIGSFQTQLASLAPRLGPNSDGDVRVLLVHHSWGYQGTSLKMDQGSKQALQNFVGAHEVRVVLTGHTHTPNFRTMTRGRFRSYELCCGTTTQLDYIPYEWKTAMGTLPVDRKWPSNTLLLHEIVADAGELTWETQMYHRTMSNGFVPIGAPRKLPI